MAAKLLDEPLLEDVLRSAGFELATNPGAWRGRFGVGADLMVPVAFSGGSSRRSARLRIHGNRVARRTTGLELALVDNEVHEIVALDAADQRMVRRHVAGPAALLVAKVSKIEERRDNSARHQPKDGLDVLRLRQATSTEAMAQRLADLASDPLARRSVASHSFAGPAGEGAGQHHQWSPVAVDVEPQSGRRAHRGRPIPQPNSGSLAASSPSSARSSSEGAARPVPTRA